MKTWLVGTLAAAGAVMSIAGEARSAPVTYTLTGTFSGTLDALSFTSVTGTLQFTGDTSNTQSLGAGYYTNTNGVSTVTLAGIGTAIVLSPSFGVIGSFDGAGFYDISNAFGASVYDPALGDYALSAPFADTASLEIADAFLQPYSSELTSLGVLTFTGDDSSSATFTAVETGASPATVPEPASWTLLAGGFAAVGGLVRRGRAASARIA